MIYYLNDDNTKSEIDFNEVLKRCQTVHSYYPTVTPDSCFDRIINMMAYQAGKVIEWDNETKNKITSLIKTTSTIRQH